MIRSIKKYLLLVIILGTHAKGMNLLLRRLIRLFSPKPIWMQIINWHSGWNQACDPRKDLMIMDYA